MTLASDAHYFSSRKQKWPLRFLLIGLVIAFSFETVSVTIYGIFDDSTPGRRDSTAHALDNDRALQTMPTLSAPIGDGALRRRPLTSTQVKKLKLFRQTHPSLWNHSDQTLLEQSPYVHFGKYQYQFYAQHPEDKVESMKVIYLLENEEPNLVASSRTVELFDRSVKTGPLHKRPQAQRLTTTTAETDTWVLPNPLKHPTRNHETIILERATGNDDSSVVAVTLLGRFSRYVQWMDLITGQQWSKRTDLKDPAGMPLDDLNHVSAVLVESRVLDENSVNQTKKEIWLPCGFHGDRAGSEVSSVYVRIVDVITLQIRTGPKLPIAGGACVATAVHVIPNEPPMICIFAGTKGTHDKGKFIKETACYDRERSIWWSPFGNLPYGLDHGSLAFIPAGVCHPADPARIIILNFRTKPYGDAHPEMLAFDIPSSGWTQDELEATSGRKKSRWYLYYNDTRKVWNDTKDVGRDASGTIVVNGGRQIVNFGGTYHYPQDQTRKRGRFSMIRSFDVCLKEWSVIGDLGFQTFALQSAASAELQLAITCGGEAPMQNSNGHWCFVNRFHNNMKVSNRYALQE